MRLLDLAVLVLQQQRVRAVQHAGPAVGERRGVLAEPVPVPPASMPTISTDSIADERMEHADGVRAAADAGDDGIGQAARLRSSICARASLADHGLQLAHQVRIRMRADRRAEM